MPNAAVQTYWQTYLDSLSPTERADLPTDPPPAEAFGDNAELADSLAALVLAGTKAATAALVWEYELEGVPLTAAGELEIVLNSTGEPVCILEYTAIEVVPFDQVTAEFAAREGEGDRTLEWWRNAHWNYFSRRCAVIGREPAMDMPVVCQQFRVAWPPRDPGTATGGERG